MQAASGFSNQGWSKSFSNISEPMVINVIGEATSNFTDPGGATNFPVRFYPVGRGFKDFSWDGAWLRPRNAGMILSDYLPQ